MIDIIPVSETRIVNPTLGEAGGFAASLLRKAIAKANPEWTRKQVREAARLRIQEEQPLAVANLNEASRRGYLIEKQVVSKSGRIYTTHVPPTRSKDRKVSLSTMSTADIETELLRRRTLAVA
jgi:hypothetical protein